MRDLESSIKTAPRNDGATRAEAIQSLIKFVEERQSDDLLITGFTEMKKNPYRRERVNKCAVM